MSKKSTFTLTFGDQAENHKGMEIIGNMDKEGYKLDDLKKIKSFFDEKGGETIIYNLNKILKKDDIKKYGKNGLNENAYVLVIKNGVDLLIGDRGADKLHEEQDNLEKDTKAYMYGKVVNKKARYNLCFDEKSRDPNYEEGKGRIVGYKEVPLLLG